MDDSEIVGGSSSATSVYCSTLEQLSAVDASFASTYSSAVEEQPAAQLLKSSEHWTTIDSTTDEDDGEFVRVIPERKVRKFESNQIKLLEKIGEGDQATIRTAVYFTTSLQEKYWHEVLQTPVSDEQEPLDLRAADIFKFDEKPYVAKLFKGRYLVSGRRRFLGSTYPATRYANLKVICIDGDTFYLLMQKYDSLRYAIDKRMEEKNCDGRPFLDVLNVLKLIIQIALGMRFFLANSIIHRDLKAYIIFINLSPEDDMPNAAYIGDFDAASNVVETLFWRAPEVLQALKNKKRPVFTPKADVYTFAMTCYEIMTGGIPLISEGVGYSDYDVVVSGKRPKLPSNLNPKMKDFINRCWHQDPEARPTFNEIVVELKGFHKELVTGPEFASKTTDRIFDMSNSPLDTYGADPETCLVELKELLEALVVKYNQADFLVQCLEIVADMKQFQSQFGLRSYKEQPELPFPEWLTREKLRDSMKWKMKVVGRIRANVVEMVTIFRLILNVVRTIDEDHAFNRFADIQHENLQTDPERLRIYEASMSDLKAWVEECHLRVLPDKRHSTCLESPRQACDLCRRVDPEFLDREDDNLKYCLYVDNGSAFKKLITSVVSFHSAYAYSQIQYIVVASTPQLPH